MYVVQMEIIAADASGAPTDIRVTVQGPEGEWSGTASKPGGKPYEPADLPTLTREALAQYRDALIGKSVAAALLN